MSESGSAESSSTVKWSTHADRPVMPIWRVAMLSLNQNPTKANRSVLQKDSISDEEYRRRRQSLISAARDGEIKMSKGHEEDEGKGERNINLISAVQWMVGKKWSIPDEMKSTWPQADTPVREKSGGSVAKERSAGGVTKEEKSALRLFAAYLIANDREIVRRVDDDDAWKKFFQRMKMHGQMYGDMAPGTVDRRVDELREIVREAVLKKSVN